MNGGIVFFFFSLSWKFYGFMCCAFASVDVDIK